MLTIRVIPCLDVRDGRIVKGVRFQGLRDAGDPASRAAMYEETGADEIVMLDVSATNEARATAARTVRAIRRVLSIPLTVGGGIRSIDDAARLLDAGADKVSINSAAVRDPSLITRLADRFGRQCVVLAIDATRNAGHTSDGRQFAVLTRSGTTAEPIDAGAWASEGESRGAGEILLTSFDRDGTGDGYDLDLLRHIASAVGVPVIASGGARTVRHLADALHAGADAVLAASIFHDGITTPDAIKRELADLGIAVRPPEATVTNDAVICISGGAKQ
ncbi:MAG: imidazole glycerol phosphate synthase subunit HisF [Phycisphaeraceae bacterium]|nr:imidazole glycerol phosphate synthase subunit HisF [Phycisphaeraceae bacterium]MBX3366045.1 imidazole glycerol phosphate synthase subunit HisF [Phycisphaeraceae bacterium]